MGYGYDPSLGAAVVFLILFAASTSLHGYQMIRTKTWFFIPLCIGAILQVLGYLFRTLSAGSSDPQADSGSPKTYYILQTIVILIAPALFAASIYMELGRIAELTAAESYLLVRRKWLTRFFVTGDVISFVMQAGGGGMMASDNQSSATTGKGIAVGGLFVQVIFFGLFVFTSLLFDWRLHNIPTKKVKDENPPYKRHLSALYITSVLIFVRSIVRVVEFIQGFQGYIQTHEVFLYIFDSLPMIIVLIVLNWVHPSEIKSLLSGGGKLFKGVKLINISGDFGSV